MLSQRMTLQHSYRIVNHRMRRLPLFKLCKDTSKNQKVIIMGADMSRLKFQYKLRPLPPFNGDSAADLLYEQSDKLHPESAG